MKKVTIPTCANPFVVIVNGMKYTYPAGETVEVPDDVAEVIEQHEETHNNPKPDPVPPPYSGGVKSWNDLEDKPFDEKEIISDTLVWDGTPSDTIVDLGGAAFHHLSGYVPTEEELVGATVSVEVQGTVVNHTVRVTDIASLDQNVFGIIVPNSGSNIPVIVISRADNYTCTFMGAELFIKNKGISFMDMEGFLIVTALKIPGANKFPYTEVTPLDAKYLPEPMIYDLRDIGLTDIVFPTTGTVFKTVNTTALRRALDKGAVRFIFEATIDGKKLLYSSISTAQIYSRYTGVTYHKVIIPFEGDVSGSFLLNIEITSTAVSAMIYRLTTALT